MAKQVMPEAALERRRSDLRVSDDQLLKISLFSQLKRKPSLDKYPGTFVVRKYKKGEVICRQGEAGWTAFYPLTTEDVLMLRLADLRQTTSRSEQVELEAEVATVTTRFTYIKSASPGSERDQSLRRVATVHLAVARQTPRSAPGIWKRLRRRLAGRAGKRERPLYIPIDGPRDVDYESLRAAVYEGEVFGEMSCLYRSPRSGTVVAGRECYVLEMMRNILDQLLKDPAYKAKTDELYKKRVLQLHLQKVPLFRDLTPEQFDALRAQVELLTFDAGQIICDEHDRADGMYLVRSGLVKLLKKSSALLADSHVRDWTDLIQGLKEGQESPDSPRGWVWRLLPPAAREYLSGTPTPAPAPAPAQRQEVLYALNDLLKNRKFADAKELQPLLAQSKVQDRVAEFPAKRAEFTDQEARQFNRMLLEFMFPRALRTHLRRVGPECVLSYYSRGDFFGEIGLMTDEPRQGTCLATGHSPTAKEAGHAEVVRIPPAALRSLVKEAPQVRERLEKAAAERLKLMKQRASAPVWEEGDQVQYSEHFERLGLIQGQRLMLIDLDRCVRCDECVRACADTHDDGRSRLFLDGPRFGKYLVPISCRSCLDPVCMIGCPVGSIHRGDNGEIVIEDWCIGCGLCANQCPYGSIQMHDVGIIPEKARGWRVQYSANVKGDAWAQPKFHDGAWALVSSPFRYEPEFRSKLKSALGEVADDEGKSPGLCFRYEFSLAPESVRGGSRFKIETTSADPALAVWVNGHALTSEKPKGNRREYWIPQPGAAADVPVILRAGRNVLAARATPGADDPLLELRMDEVRKPPTTEEGEEDVTEKLVTERAVVCDLCSSQYGQVPACVNACPHDAAMRVDAQNNFPTR